MAGYALSLRCSLIHYLQARSPRSRLGTTSATHVIPRVHSPHLLNYGASKCLEFENIILPLRRIPNTLFYENITRGNLLPVGSTGLCCVGDHE